MKNKGGLMSENTMNNLKIGVDVGGTKIEAVLVDAMGTVLGSARIPARHGSARHRRHYPDFGPIR